MQLVRGLLFCRHTRTDFGENIRTGIELTKLAGSKSRERMDDRAIVVSCFEENSVSNSDNVTKHANFPHSSNRRVRINAGTRVRLGQMLCFCFPNSKLRACVIIKIILPVAFVNAFFRKLEEICRSNFLMYVVGSMGTCACGVRRYRISMYSWDRPHSY
uniref:Uncharacterized protein n=1 Tax=Parascaris equorum TaxID=6256 RepID=A0A914S8N2_PAREQ